MSEPSWELLGGGGVLGPAGIDYIGAWAAGVAYQPGQIVSYNGVDYLAVNPSTGQTPPPAAPLSTVAYGTTLPASPANGQEAVLVDSLTNPTYQWRFRYNAGSTSPYKWEFVGGVPLAAFGGTNNNQVALADLAGGPVVTVPRTGEYLLLLGVFMQNASGYSAAYEIHATAYIGPTDSGVYLNFIATGTYAGGNLSRTAAISLTAGQAINIKVASIGTPGSNFSQGQLSLTPKRVA